MFEIAGGIILAVIVLAFWPFFLAAGVIAGVIGIVIIAGLVAAALVPTIWWAAILGFGTILGGVGLMGVILFSPLRSLFLWTRNGVRSRLMAGQPHPEGSAGLRRAE
jgi:hypothetical protein